MKNSRSRKPKGTPVGGQFAAGARDEAEVSLTEALDASNPMVDDYDEVEDAGYEGAGQAKPVKRKDSQFETRLGDKRAVRRDLKRGEGRQVYDEELRNQIIADGQEPDYPLPRPYVPAQAPDRAAFAAAAEAGLKATLGEQVGSGMLTRQRLEEATAAASPQAQKDVQEHSDAYRKQVPEAARAVSKTGFSAAVAVGGVVASDPRTAVTGAIAAISQVPDTVKKVKTAHRDRAYNKTENRSEVAAQVTQIERESLDSDEGKKTFSDAAAYLDEEAKARRAREKAEKRRRYDR